MYLQHCVITVSYECTFIVIIVSVISYINTEVTISSKTRSDVDIEVRSNVVLYGVYVCGVCVRVFVCVVCVFVCCVCLCVCVCVWCVCVFVCGV